MYSKSLTLVLYSMEFNLWLAETYLKSCQAFFVKIIGGWKRNRSCTMWNLIIETELQLLSLFFNPKSDISACETLGAWNISGSLYLIIYIIASFLLADPKRYKHVWNIFWIIFLANRTLSSVKDVIQKKDSSEAKQYV